MQVLARTKDIERDDWLDLRRKGIGGSDVSAICGLNKWRSPVAVYLDKIGELPPVEETEAMYWGTTLEDIVAQEFSKRTGLKVQRRNAIFQHPKHDFMLANIDRWIVGSKAGLEVKTANEYTKDEWIGEQVPTAYALQCHHYMACTGAEQWYVAVLIGGNKFEWRVIERDEDIINNLIMIEHDFWHNHVLAKVPPAYGGHDTDLLNSMYPQSNPDSIIELEEEHYDLVMKTREAKTILESAKYNFEDFKNKVKAVMGEHEKAFFQNDLVFTWKSNKKGVRSFKIFGGDE
jgi:putative phage-type endonuclease